MSLFDYDSNRKNVILVTGLAGTGKSSVARMLNERLSGSYFLNSDRFILEHPEHLKADDRGSDEHHYKMHDLKLKEIGRILEQYHSVVTDATFATQELRDKYYSALSGLGVNLYLVHLTAPDDVVKNRIYGSPERLAYHQKRKSEYEPIREPHISVSNSDSLEGCVDKIISSGGVK